MKKLLIASMTAALTAGVWAADFQQTQEGFENDYDASKDESWTTETTWDNVSVGTYSNDAYEYATSGDNTAAFGGPGSHYLKLETENGKALYRKLAEGTGATVTVDAGNSYVLDTLVQFTATDETPTPAVADKFILWLKSNEETDGATTYNLMVTCGAFADGGMTIEKDSETDLPVPVSFALDAAVQPSAWARVSVKAIQLDSIGNVGFVVYVDGKLAVATDYDIGTPSMINEGAATSYFAQQALFPSLVDFMGGSTLEVVGFEGTGAIDDLQIVTAAKAPSFTQYNPSEVVRYTVTFDANGVTATGMPHAQKVDSGATATKPDAPTADGYTFVGWYKDAAGTTEFNFEDAITGNVTVYAKWTKNEVKPVAPGETVPGSSEAEAIAALTKAGIATPSTVTDADAYAAKFEATATANGDGTYSATWTVTADAEASLKSDADDVLAQTLEAVLSGTETTVTIKAQAGFYYTVLSAEAVDAAEYSANGWTLAGDTVELALPEKSGTQGFYKIGISAVAPTTAE